MSKLVIVCALMAEAVPLIDSYNMRKQPKLPSFHLYCSSGIDLIICGMGRECAQQGIAAYKRNVQVNAQTKWLNIGIAGALLHEVGALVWANSVGGKTIAKPSFCKYQAPMDVRSLRKPSANYRAGILFDMEAESCLSRLTQDCVQFKPEIHFFCAKVVSDNLDSNMYTFDKKVVTALINQNMLALNRGVKNIVKTI